MQSKLMPDDILRDVSVSQFISNNKKFGLGINYNGNGFRVTFDGILTSIKPEAMFIPVLFSHKEKITIIDKMILAFHF
jgi:hypothetical protein